MIVKVAPNRRDGKSSFEELGDYITEGIEQSGDRPDRTNWDDLTQYITKQSVLDAMGADVEKTIAVEVGNVHSLRSAPHEMGATAAHCYRVTNPVLHYILSWPEGERPEARAIFRAARHTLAALGLLEHQYIIAVHDNTENRHAHVEVSRVHPVTLRAARLEWMFKTLHKAAREAEIDHGWSHDLGLYEVMEVGGKKFVVERGDPALPGPGRPSFGANRSEIWNGEESLETWCRGAPADALRAALASPKSASWQDLHAALAPFGLELRDSGGGGMRVHVVTQDAAEGNKTPDAIEAVSASKAFRFLKRGDAEARFGSFEAADPRRYPTAETAGTVPKREPAKRLERRLERKASRDALRERFRAEREEATSARREAMDAQRDDHAANDKARTEQAKVAYAIARAAIVSDASLTAAQKRATYLIAQATLGQRQAQLREQMREERAVRRANLPVVLNWREWLESQAALGDDAAISAIRGLVYQEGRDAKKRGDPVPIENSDVGSISPAVGQATDPYVRALRRLSWGVSSHGVVTYRFMSTPDAPAGAVAFVDAGSRLRFGGPIVSDDALRLAIRYAADKWNGELKLSGGDRTFRERVARMATEMRIDLQNPDLRALQRRTLDAIGPMPYSVSFPTDRQHELLARKFHQFSDDMKDLSEGNDRSERDRRYDRTFFKPEGRQAARAYGDPLRSRAKALDGMPNLSSVPVARLGDDAHVLPQDHTRSSLVDGRAERADSLRQESVGERHGLILRDAVPATPRGKHRGKIVAVDADHVYQRTKNGVVQHARSGSFDWPETGRVVLVTYLDRHVAKVEIATRGSSRGR